MKTIVFDDSTVDFVLSIFGKEVDEEGYIIEKSTGDRVLTPFGDEVPVDNFAGFAPGSEIVLTKDFPSLLEYTSVGD